MNDEIRRAALSAAARLTVGVGIVGCGGAAIQEYEDTSYESKSATAPTPYEESGDDASVSDAGATRTPAVDRDAKAPLPETCEQRFEDAFPDGAPPWFNGTWLPDGGSSAVDDPELAACCEALITEADGGTSFDLAKTEAFRNAGCCSVKLDSNVVGTHCTPWGPPAPPPMPMLEVA